MEYRILGPLAALRDGQHVALGGLRQRAVLAVLLLAGGRSVETDHLIDHVWGGDAPPKPLASLRSYVTNLRRLLGSDRALLWDGTGYRLDIAGAVVDVVDFERLAARGRKLLDAGDAAGAKVAFDDAFERWRGAPLADLRSLNFAIPEIHRLDTLRADAVESRFEAALQLGVDADLIADLESEVAGNPMRERLWWQLMLAGYRSGHRTDALRAYERVTHILDRELGVTPGLALERLATDIRNESPTLDWQPPTVVAALTCSGRGELFGRSSEVRRLRAAVDAAADGRGGLVVIMADSGMGKTALAHRAAEMADEAGMATSWASHASEPERPPSWAWAHAVRELAGQLPSGAKEFDAPLPVWWSVATEDANVIEPQKGDGFDALEATAAALAELAARRPSLIVLEDLHCADRFTHAVLEHLASAGRRMPLLILATWQEGGNVRAPGIRAFKRLRSRTDIDFITLRGLDVDATAALVTDVCGREPLLEFTTSVRTRTGGNPFYIRELVRLLEDGGRLGRLDAAVDGGDVPEAVSEVIRRRMSALPKLSRTALHVAAVSGSDIPVSRLAAVAGCAILAAADSLTVAQRAGLIVETSSQPSSFGFSHGLVRDAIAMDITGVHRARLHADIARAYAAEPGAVASQDAIDGAHHAWRAGDELEPQTALLLLNRARSDAWSRSAYREVADGDRRALEVCARLPLGAARLDVETDLLLQLASVEAVVSGQSSAEVLKGLRRSEDPAQDAVQSTAAVAMGCLEACGTGRYRDAATLSDSLIEFFDVTGDPIAGSAGYYVRALTQFMRGHLDLALAAVSMLDSAVPPVDWELYGALASFEVLAFGVAAHAHGLCGDPADARSALSDGIAMATRRRDAFGAAVLRTADIQMAAMTGAADGLAERADDVVAELTDLGIEQFIGGARLIRGWARAVGPGGVDTVDDMRAALHMHGQGGRRIFSPLYFGLLSDATAAHRDVGEAQLLLGQAETIAADTGERVWDAQLSGRRLRLAARRRR